MEMHYLGYLLKFIIFFLSNFGYWEFLRKKTKINIYFLPSLTVALQISILYFAGLFNLLYEVAIVIWLSGVILLIYGYENGLETLNCYKKVGYIFLAVSMIVALFYVRGKIFIHYDNFSHWAIVVKQMLTTNRYPNFQDTIIMFKEYPLGSATYIYYMALFVGKSESIQMFAQVYMILVCLVPMFIYCEKNKFISCAFMFFVTNFFLIYNIRITDLLVDTLLPIVSMNGLLYLYIYGRGDKEHHVNKTELYFAVPFLIQILQIKNSGIFFFVIALVCILAGIKNNGEVLKRVIVALLPFLTVILWHKHCDYVFDSSAATKHAMTAENYKMIIGSKSLEEIKSISYAVLKFSAAWKDVWLFWFCLAVVGIISYSIVKSCRKAFNKLAIASVVIFVTYQIGMLFMYLFSMPGGEALELAGIGRYSKTILLALFYGIVLLDIKIFSQIQLKSRRDITILVMIWGSMFICQRNTMGQFATVFTYSLSSVEEKYLEGREWMEGLKNKFSIPSNDQYCFLVKKEDSADYLKFLGKYIFQSDNIMVIPEATKDTLNTIENVRYILIHDNKKPAIQDWIEENYFGQVGCEVIIREK